MSQEAVPAQNAIDLLNVNITQGGKSVKKRDGYGLETTLSISTSAAHGIYKFFDSSGNEVRLAFNDSNISASVGGGAWGVIITTGTLGATWDCVNYLGFAYCVSSANDNPIKTNGTTAGTTGQPTIPAGTMVATTGDRLLVAGVASNPSRLYYSGSATFTDFTLGTQNSSSSFEDITAPGSKLTHIAYRNGRWLWWKDQSFGFIVGTGQFDLQILTVSSTIGTFDNTDVYDSGTTFFRGSDSYFYRYDGSNLSRDLSIDIGPTLKLTNRRKSNSWTQTSKADFDTGISTPTSSLSTSVSNGDIVLSTFSVAFSSGIQGVVVTTGNFVSAFETAANQANWLSTGAISVSYSTVINGFNCGTMFGSQGNTQAIYSFSAGSLNFLAIEVLNGSDLSLISSATLPTSTFHCTQSSYTVAISTPQIGTPIVFRVHLRNGGTDSMFYSSETYRAGSYASIFYWNDSAGTYGSSQYSFGFQKPILDWSTGAQDTGFTGAYYLNTTQITQSGLDPIVPIDFHLQSATSTTGAWADLGTSTSTLYNPTKRYIRAQSSGFGALSFQATASTATYYSSVHNAPSLTSWNTFGITDVVNGGSITYFTRASTNTFDTLSSTPAWVSQTKNAIVAASTGTYFQTRADFAITLTTQTPTLSDFTFNWFEGTAADKMYGTYFDNALWFSVSLGTAATTNNRILRYDLLNQCWTVYDIAANGFLTYNNQLYFGDPTAGKIYRFGNSTSDNGTAINAYWKSKAFFGSGPFGDDDLRVASWYMAESSGTITMTYTLNESTTVVKTLSLSDNTKNIIQTNWNFPLGSIASNFNVQFGETSTNSAWEVFGGAVMGQPRPWKVYP